MFQKSLNQLKNGGLSLIGYNAMLILLPIMISLPGIFMDDAMNILLSLLSSVVQVVLTIGLIKYVIRVASYDGKSSFKGLYSNFFMDLMAMIAYYFVVGTIVAIMIIPIAMAYTFWAFTLDTGSAFVAILFGWIGMVLVAMIIGMIIGLFVAFIPYAILDESLSEMRMGKRFALGFKLSKGNKLRIIGCYLLVGLVNTIGAMCLLVGLIITIPIGQLLMANLYVDVRDKYLYEDIDKDVPIYEM